MKQIVKAIDQHLLYLNLLMVTMLLSTVAVDWQMPDRIEKLVVSKIYQAMLFCLVVAGK